MQKKSKYFVGIIVILIISLIFIVYKKKTVGFVEGDNKIKITNYNLKEQGFNGLEELFRENVELPNILTVDTFSGNLSTDGSIEDFDLLLQGFNDEKQYIQSYRFSYNAKKKILNYAGPKSNIKNTIPIIYNENSEFSYLGQEIKKIPLQEQIQQLDFPRYVIEYYSNTKLSKGEPVMKQNGLGNFSVLTFDEYRSGIGGNSDGHTAIIFTLHDGGGANVTENKICYIVTPKNIEEISGNKNSFMKKDYIINGYKMKVTRDYGETWIDIPISEEDLESTLYFYKMGIEIPSESYYISDNVGGTIALIYGEDPKILLSKDDGLNWETIELELEEFKSITRRVIGFTSEMEGYMALGTDWSMGSGESKVLYLTNDGGSTWDSNNLPLSGSSNTLTGIQFSDINNAILSLEDRSDVNKPVLFATKNRGESWDEIQLPWNEMPSEVQYLTQVDSLVYEDGTYKLTLGQGIGQNNKVVFYSDNILSGWKFKEYYKDVIHYIG
ncbi:WD40/YVTN/BNR-like repeat-containing protein [Clostridium culturomicium]|uniref:WD40/YVTN/BNR-like repeat-containing protein n=1 Tax=Clostridium culturomicium TaxID=1499683 RepID=UPI000590917F|nr:hypothetical protein [Clostridium culturomicium]